MSRNESTTIIRTNKRENPYVIIDKHGLNDDRLSWKAKGLLAYLLSKPDNWQVYERDLIKRATDGRDAVRTGLRELEKYGYLARRQIRREDGSFGHMEYVVYERPIEPKDTLDGKPVHGCLPSAENPSAENPSADFPTHNNNDLNNNDLNLFECMKASAETAAAVESSFSIDPIFETLNKYVPSHCFIKGVPLGPAYIREIYLMLINQFSTQLDPVIVEIACALYFERACQPSTYGVTMKLNIQNPVGYFRFCYKDAIKEYKLSHNHEKEENSRE